MPRKKRCFHFTNIKRKNKARKRSFYSVTLNQQYTDHLSQCQTTQQVISDPLELFENDIEESKSFVKEFIKVEERFWKYENGDTSKNGISGKLQDTYHPSQFKMIQEESDPRELSTNNIEDSKHIVEEFMELGEKICKCENGESFRNGIPGTELYNDCPSNPIYLAQEVDSDSKELSENDIEDSKSFVQEYMQLKGKMLKSEDVESSENWTSEERLHTAYASQFQTTHEIDSDITEPSDCDIEDNKCFIKELLHQEVKLENVELENCMTVQVKKEVDEDFV